MMGECLDTHTLGSPPELFKEGIEVEIIMKIYSKPGEPHTPPL